MSSVAYLADEYQPSKVKSNNQIIFETKFLVDIPKSEYRSAGFCPDFLNRFGRPILWYREWKLLITTDARDVKYPRYTDNFLQLANNKEPYYIIFCQDVHSRAKNLGDVIIGRTPMDCAFTQFIFRRFIRDEDMMNGYLRVYYNRQINAWRAGVKVAKKKRDDMEAAFQRKLDANGGLKKTREELAVEEKYKLWKERALMGPAKYARETMKKALATLIGSMRGTIQDDYWIVKQQKTGQTDLDIVGVKEGCTEIYDDPIPDPTPDTDANNLETGHGAFTMDIDKKRPETARIAALRSFGPAVKIQEVQDLGDNSENEETDGIQGNAGQDGDADMWEAGDYDDANADDDVTGGGEGQAENDSDMEQLEEGEDLARTRILFQGAELGTITEKSDYGGMDLD